ncbi:cilia- and flagella-associated protein 95-like isoform X2 [Lineus longissimus]|uniref:cilia- and flagella-associated protein 95-like isoform X2 n=1 Tax=Lineus longissimus TaxID=88925 RepID=UPI002B4DE1D7
MTSFATNPDFVERKGSLFLRSDHMNYSRATLNSNWHQARESEPKDYNISTAPVRDLCKATYERIGDVTDGSLPETTYQEHSNEVFLKKDFEEQETRKQMINEDTLAHADIDREDGERKRGHSPILPGHHPGYDTQHLETTHLADYKPPYPYTPIDEAALQGEDNPDNTNAYKRCHSQFTDTMGHRRPGWNTWQDESGIYGNTHYKRQVFQPTKTIPERLE